MNASAFVLQLVRAHYRGDEAAFADAAKSLARGCKTPAITGAIMGAVENNRGRGNASRIEKSLNQQLNPLQAPPPVEVGGMLHQLKPVTLDSLMLDRELQFKLDEFVVELEYREALSQRNLRPRSRLLFHGPPGNGKTSAAAAIAHRLELPAYAINFGELISKYLGETGSNLTKLFRSLRPNTVVVFDEIDAIGSSRGSIEGGTGKENNSIVNVLLTLLDRNPNGIIVATTNRPDILDPALMRRFDEHVEFPEPNDAQKQSLAERLCDSYGVDPVDARGCRNFDEVAKVCATYARRLVMRELLAADEDSEDNQESNDGTTQEQKDLH